MGHAAKNSDEQEEPWSSLLDPAANARAIGEVQAQGLRAAGELVERFARLVDGDPGQQKGTDDPSGEGADPPPGGDLGRLVEVWLDLLQRTADSFGRVSDRPRPGAAGTARVDVDVTDGSASGGVRMTADRLGTLVGEPVEVWLHNSTNAPVGPIALHCGPLLSGEGSALGAVVTFHPEGVAELPPRSSRGIAMVIGPGAELAIGSYRSLVQATGAAAVWLPLEVVVREMEP